MKKLLLMLVLFTFVVLYVSPIYAQYEPSTQIGLPEGAIARLGKGSIRGITYSPDGTQIAVTTSIGVWLYDAQTGEELDLIIGRNIDNSSHVVFSPDHKIIVTYNWWDRQIRLWNTRKGKPIKTLTGHKVEINGVVFSADSKTIATASDDKTIRLWNGWTGKNIKTLSGHTKAVNLVSFSPDGKTLVSGSSDKTIKLWNVRSGKVIHTFTELQGPIAFSQDGKSLIGINETKSSTHGVKHLVQMWDTTTGQLLKTFSWNNIIYSLSYSPDSNKIAAGGYDGTIRLWNATNGQAIKTFRPHTDAIYIVVFSPDGNRIATASRDDTMRWWNIHTGENIKTFSEYLGGRSYTKYSQDGKTIAIERHDKVWLRDASTGKHLNIFKGHTQYIAGVAFSPKKNIIATGSADKTARLWDAHTGKNIKTYKGHTHTVYTPVFSPDGNKLATHCRDNALRLWDINTGKNIITHQRERQGVNFTFSPDSQLLAIGSDAGEVSLWNTNTGEKIKTFVGHSSYVYSPLYFSDGNTIVTHSRDRSVRMWNIQTGENIKTLNIIGTVNSVVHSPDEGLMAITSHEETVSFWNVETGQLIKTFEGHKKRGIGILKRFSLKKEKNKTFRGPPEHIRTTRYSPNGKSVTTVRNNNTVQMWDISTGKRTGKLISPLKDDPPESTTDIVYSPDGNTLATIQLGNLGGTVRLWDTSTGKLLKTLKGYTYCGNSLEFSPDSKTISTGHWDGTVLLWDIPSR